MTPFYVLGGMLAAWALIVTALGITRHGFPASKGAERAVMLISAVLVAGAIGSGVITAANEDEGEEAHATAAEREHPTETTDAEGPSAPPPAPVEEEQAEEQPAGETAASELELRADESALAFDEERLEAKAGDVTLTMTNPSQIPHNVALEGEGVDEQGDVVQEGQVSTVSAELQPGEYTFYCSVEGHREGGMEGTLVVE